MNTFRVRLDIHAIKTGRIILYFKLDTTTTIVVSTDDRVKIYSNILLSGVDIGDYIPLLSFLSEEEYFQYSLVFEYKIDIELLKRIQDHGIRYLNENMNHISKDCTKYENTEVYFQY